MGYYDKIANKNSSKHYCFTTAYLQTQELIEKPFYYEEQSNNNIITNSIMPMEFNIKSKTIYTTYTWLNFVLGAKVRFENGEFLTISSINPDYDNKKAITGNGVRGLFITF